MDTVTHSGLTGIAILVLAALMCGMAMERMKQPAFVGYILAGLLLGPTALGLVEDRKQIDIIAELGVLMLLFVIGMELSIRLFLRLWKFVLLATGLQILAAGGNHAAVIKCVWLEPWYGCLAGVCRGSLQHSHRDQDARGNR